MDGSEVCKVIEIGREKGNLMGNGVVRWGVLVGLVAGLCGGVSRADAPAACGAGDGTETIVMVWHGEKTVQEFGHKYLDDFAKAVVKEYGSDAVVPEWPGKDYDSIFVIRLKCVGDETTATFAVDHEGLDGKLGDGPPPSAGK